MRTLFACVAVCASAIAGSFNLSAADAFGARMTGPSLTDITPEQWDRLLSERSTLTELRLGGSDFTFSGPVAEVFRRERVPQDSSRARKFLGLPIVRLFVPVKMERPPGGTGRYFAWSDAPQPWAVRASLAASPPGHSMNGAYR